MWARQPRPTWVGLLEAPSSLVECGFIQHAGEGGGVGKGKKDTGYLYKAFMVARRALLTMCSVVGEKHIILKKVGCALVYGIRTDY
jgi:hypothetical protein